MSDGLQRSVTQYKDFKFRYDQTHSGACFQLSYAMVERSLVVIGVSTLHYFISPRAKIILNLRKLKQLQNQAAALKGLTTTSLETLNKEQIRTEWQNLSTEFALAFKKKHNKFG